MNTAFHFDKKDNNLALIVEGRNKPPYNLPINSLAEVRDGESEWILHLLEDKDWVSKEMLYDLARQIIKYHPDNKIDWVNTFTTVESKYLHDEGNKSLKKPDSITARLYQEVEANRNRVATPEYQKELTKRVEENMKSYGIPVGQK